MLGIPVIYMDKGKILEGFLILGGLMIVVFGAFYIFGAI